MLLQGNLSIPNTRMNFFVIIQAFLSTAPHCFAQGFEHLQDKGCFTVVQSKLLMVYFGSGGGEGGALEKKVG